MYKDNDDWIAHRKLERARWETSRTLCDVGWKTTLLMGLVVSMTIWAIIS